MDHQTRNDLAKNAAINFCKENPDWELICNIGDVDSLYMTWSELPNSIRSQWEKIYPGEAEDAWKEFGDSVCKVAYGYITGDGAFYREIHLIPVGHDFMMVFKVGSNSK